MPPPVAGYNAWWDASQVTGVSDGASLATWPDLSGNGYHLTAAGSSQPTFYKTTSAYLINGLPAVWFNGSSNHMSNGLSPSMSQPYTIVAVSQNKASATANYFLVDSNSDNVAFYYLNTGATGWAIYAGASQAIGSGFDQNVHYSAAVFNGSSSVIRMDGTSVTANPGANGYSTTLLGSGSAGGYWNGPICEVLIYPSALSSAQLDSLYSYLQAKWLTPAAINGTATVSVGPLTTTVAGTVIPAGVAALPLGPLTVAATGTVLALATGTAALPLGPLTLTSLTSDLISLGPLTLSVAGTVVIPAPPYVRITAFDRPATTIATLDR